MIMGINVRKYRDLLRKVRTEIMEQQLFSELRTLYSLSWGKSHNDLMWGDSSDCLK